jgi:hypothetical protein
MNHSKCLSTIGVFIIIGFGISLPPAFGDRFFQKNSTWYEKIPDDPAVMSDSDNYVNDLIINSSKLSISYKDWSIPIFYTDSNTPTYNITVTTGSVRVKQAIEDNSWHIDVPIPSNARPAGYGQTGRRDNHLVILRPETNEAWTMYFAKVNETTGLVDTADRVKRWDLTTDGVDQPHTGANPRVVAVATFVGLITYEEIVNKKYIDHALSFSYNALTDREPYSIYPVKNANAGKNSRQWALSGGMRIQLDPSVDITTLGLNEAGEIIARALQEYGMILVESSGPGYNNLHAESLDFNPNRSWQGILGSLDGIPLDKFRVIEPIYPNGVTVPDYQSLSLNAVVKPKIIPDGGILTGTISLKTTTSDASVRYTTDGSIPTSVSTLYTGPLTNTTSATVKARAFKEGYNDSGVASASFTASSSDETPPTPPTGLRVD